MINGFLNAPASLSDLDTSLNLLKDFLALSGKLSFSL